MAIIKHTELVAFTPHDAPANVWDVVSVDSAPTRNNQQEDPAHSAWVATRSTTRNV